MDSIIVERTDGIVTVTLNQPAKKALSKPSKFQQGKSKSTTPFKDMSREKLIEAMEAKGMTEEEIEEFMHSLDPVKKDTGK